MTTEEIDKISLMRDEGKTTREIAEEFGVRVSTMRAQLDRLIKAGEIGKLRPKMRWTDERVDELIRMKNSGATVEEMTKRFDVTFDAIRQKTAALVRAGKLPREYNSWKENKLYDYLDARNLCHECYCNEKFSGYSLCPGCLEHKTLQRERRPVQKQGERLRKLRKEHKENGICIDCSKPATHGLYCYEHMIARKKAKLRYNEKSRRERMGIPTVWDIRKANRLCRLCGSPIEDGNDTLMCNACCKRMSKMATATHVRMKAEGRDFKLGRALYEQRANRSTGQGS
nr:MAG TPA: transposase [Caudoviricetes sp.]